MVPAGSRQPLPSSAACEVVKVQVSPFLAVVLGESSVLHHCVLKMSLWRTGRTLLSSVPRIPSESGPGPP